MSMRTKLPAAPACSTSSATFALRELLVEREAEVRELERDVRAEAFGRDAVEQLAVAATTARSRPRRDALAEQRRVREEALARSAAEDGTAASRLSPATKRAAPSRKPYRCTKRAGGGCRRRRGSSCGATLTPASPTIRSTSPAPPRSDHGAARGPRRVDRDAAQPERGLRRSVERKPLSEARSAAPSPPPPAAARGRAGRPRRGSTTRARRPRPPRPPPSPRRAAPRRRRRRRARRAGTARPSHGVSETFIPARFGARSRSRSITASGIA